MSSEPLAKKSLGQHWLNDLPSLEYICSEGEINSNDTVLEIGPGTGNLTKLLVKQAKTVVAVELDNGLASQLENRVSAANLTVIEQDILNFDFASLPAGYKVIANIPYYLTGKLLRVLSESSNRASIVVLLIQKEVAQRVAAPPGKMSLMSVSSQYYWYVGLGDIIPASSFTPPPKVDSQILILRSRVTPLFTGVNDKVYFQIVKSGFSARRKTLLNSLSGGLRLDKSIVANMIENAGLDPLQRAQELSLDNWHNLYNSYMILNQPTINDQQILSA